MYGFPSYCKMLMHSSACLEYNKILKTGNTLEQKKIRKAVDFVEYFKQDSFLNFILTALDFLNKYYIKRRKLT